MLNQKLIAVCGHNSVEFFNELLDRIGEAAAKVCYIPANCSTISYGSVSVPSFIHIHSEDDSLYWRICNACAEICCDIKNDNGDEDGSVTKCVPYDDEEVDEVGLLAV